MNGSSFIIFASSSVDTRIDAVALQLTRTMGLFEQEKSRQKRWFEFG